MLTGAVAVAALAFVGSKGVTRYRDALDRNNAQKIEAEQALSEAKVAVARGEHARRQLNEWAERSLPKDRDIAESLYEDWLRAQITGAGLELTQLSDRSAAGRNAQYSELTLEYRGSGTLEQLADFLYRFYSAPHLQRISAATITGADGGKKLNLTMTISALILPNATRVDKLADGEPRKLAGTLDEFRKRLTSRNLFVAYTPKGNSEQAKKDEAGAKNMVSMFTYGLDGWMMWVKNEDSKEVKHFVKGDDVEYGKVKGKIVEVGDRRAVIETDNGRMEVRLGQKFSEAVPVAAPAAQSDANPAPSQAEKSPAKPA
jgi:hypothetical protein